MRAHVCTRTLLLSVHPSSQGKSRHLSILIQTRIQHSSTLHNPRTYTRHKQQQWESITGQTGEQKKKNKKNRSRPQRPIFPAICLYRSSTTPSHAHGAKYANKVDARYPFIPSRMSAVPFPFFHFIPILPLPLSRFPTCISHRLGQPPLFFLYFSSTLHLTLHLTCPKEPHEEQRTKPHYSHRILPRTLIPPESFLILHYFRLLSPPALFFHSFPLPLRHTFPPRATRPR